MEMCSLTNHCRPELTQSGTKSVHITNCFSTLCLSSDLLVRPLEKATVPAMWHELDDYSCWTWVLYFKTFRSFTSDCQLSDDASVWTDWSCLLRTVTCCGIFVISTSEYFSFLGGWYTITVRVLYLDFRTTEFYWEFLMQFYFL